ncbi:hypothetical protein CAPTEDRAFT_221730 [Capitella teleta]|uniref:Protein naked cuticle homolog n=1 Tax=Capitella teleta TaxID=283909 RepID=R7UXT2_CAPTE|nr:hypothetical protein CAPTEDRAFT_221730 [Capitella teleta]|eukprot:ELU11388.1 hypothetical protein CAPTEDRAFT_221730 [Capitella teleta]
MPFLWKKKKSLGVVSSPVVSRKNTANNFLRNQTGIRNSYKKRNRDSSKSRIERIQNEEVNEPKKEAKESSLAYNVPLRVLLPPLTKKTPEKENSPSKFDPPASVERGVGSGMAPNPPVKTAERLPSCESDTTDNNEEKAVNVEEFECGVSVAGSTSDKQEWSFTLYDFDGQGKVTKEDIGQLLQSLYDAVGSSISLPHSGTKTLKLRLTVSPDKAKLDKKESERNNAVNVTDIHASKDADRKNNLSRGSKRLSSIEHRHLVNLVQKNMERNSQRIPSAAGQKQSKSASRRHKSDAAKTKDYRSPARGENTERRNYYLDLAGVEHVDDMPPASTGAALSAGISPTHVRPQKTSHRPSTAAHGHCLDAADPAAENKPRRLDSPRNKKSSRSREQEQARAMQQVAAWIQKEARPAFKEDEPIIDKTVVEHHHHHDHHHHHHYHHYDA